jgi:hypothetical protein
MYAVEHEEARASLRERVVALTVHVERLVVALRGVVMVPERGVEGHLCVEQDLVGLLELVDEILRALAAVDVVAQHDHELEGKHLPRRCEPLPDLVLRRRARACVADDGEAH